METAEQVADIAVSRTFSEQDLASGYSKCARLGLRVSCLGKI